MQHFAAEVVATALAVSTLPPQFTLHILCAGRGPQRSTSWLCTIENHELWEHECRVFGSKRTRKAAMINLYNDKTNQLVGSITEADLQVLQDALEEESIEDRDYYIDQSTMDVIGDGRATDHLLKVLRDALGTSDGIDIRWERS
jgi:hypothetical protein